VTRYQQDLLLYNHLLRADNNKQSDPTQQFAWRCVFCDDAAVKHVLWVHTTVEC
jgi:hypothetical protein